jgi:hypothetical protein
MHMCGCGCVCAGNFFYTQALFLWLKMHPLTYMYMYVCVRLQYTGASRSLAVAGLKDGSIVHVEHGRPMELTDVVVNVSMQREDGGT